MNLLMSLVSSALVIRTGFLVQSLRSIDITYSDAETTALFYFADSELFMG